MVKNNLPSNQPNNNAVSHLPLEVVNQLVENQTKQLELQAHALELQKQADNHNFEFSQKALDVQLQDRDKQRTHDRGGKRDRYLLVVYL